MRRNRRRSPATKHPVTNRSRRRGATLLETAIALPLLLTIVLGVVDFGRFAYTYIAVTNAAREGAAYGSSHSFTENTESDWQTNLRQAVVAELQTIANFSEQQMVLADPAVLSDSSGVNRLRVEVQYPFRLIVPWPGLSGQIDVRRTVEMRFTR